MRRTNRTLGPLLAFLLQALLLFTGGAALAQTLDPGDLTRLAITQYKLDGWQTEQGLPQNTVQAMYQARNGVLWVGTGGGLARFDGQRFTPVIVPQVPELASRPVFGFLEDAEGGLWIGHSQGASRYHQGRFERVFGNELMDGRRVWAFAQGRDGVVWAATENGLVRWERGQARLFKEADGLPTKRLRTLAFDTEGTLWIGTTGGGLVSYAGGRFAVLNPANGQFPHLEVRHVLADPQGGIWAATAGAGLVHLQGWQAGQGGRQRRITMADGLPTDQLTALARDAHGTLWIGTWGAGICRLAGGRVSALGSAGGLGGDQIWSVHVDRENSVWVGTWNGGMNRLASRPFVAFGKPEGLAGDNVRSVLHARDGSAWIATAGGGVSHVGTDGRISSIGRAQGLPSDEASGLLEDADGAIWVATYTGGVSRLSPGPGAPQLQSFGLAQGLPNVDVRALLRDHAGTLWVGTASGLARFDGRRFAVVTEPGAPREGITALLRARDGSLWIGTAGDGLVRYRDGRFSLMTRRDGLPSNWVIALHEDASGSLWIGTNGEGIARLREGRVASIRVADGLWDGVAQVFLEDRNGQFWITTNRGFYRVARAELDALAEGRATRVQSTGYGPGDGLRTTTFAGAVQPAGAVDARGHLWLPSLKGLVVVDPQQLPGPGEPPLVTLEALMVGDERRPVPESLSLPPDPPTLTLRYTAGTLLHAERVRLRYRLNDAAAWIDIGTQRELVLPALPHGRHRLQLAASLDGQRWREAPVALPLEVQPRLVQTAGFQIAAGVAGLLAAWGLMQWRTLQLRRRSAEMERLVAERTEELRIANEHLSQLSFADALTGLANRRRLDEALATEWRRAARHRQPLALVVADIDAFKAYNDTLGHPAGDQCLREVAEVIRQVTGRAGDLAARYGGEEFVILVPGADMAAAAAYAERLRAACEARALPHPASSVGPLVSLSLGVAAWVPNAEASPETLLAAADAALYGAKQGGRNRVRQADDSWRFR